MVCDRCQERRATVHVQTVLQFAGDAARVPWWHALLRVLRGLPPRGALAGATHLCAACSTIPASFDPAQARRVIELEASGRPMPPGWFRQAAEVFRQRSRYHGQPLPTDVAAF